MEKLGFLSWGYGFLIVRLLILRTINNLDSYQKIKRLSTIKTPNMVQSATALIEEMTIKKGLKELILRMDADDVESRGSKTRKPQHLC
ncbi:hypothetical protein A6E08_03145 [Vibrio lentus]|nr:hypothetical protein A6E08_03145 [Vibrio lentus]PMI60470.1 hypothetical protein BCU41_19115 [Vibrio lentus]